MIQTVHLILILTFLLTVILSALETKKDIESFWAYASMHKEGPEAVENINYISNYYGNDIFKEEKEDEDQSDVDNNEQ